MTNKELAAKVKDIALHYKTLYVNGCFGAPLTASNKQRYCNNNDYNRDPSRQKMIKAASADTFGFDCVCLIKGVLWGWTGDKSKPYGGAKYASNGVPDINADTMIQKCTGISTNFSKIEIGEALWSAGAYRRVHRVRACSRVYAALEELRADNRLQLRQTRLQSPQLVEAW